MNKALALIAGTVVVGMAMAQTTVDEQACHRDYTTTVSNCARGLGLLGPATRAGVQRTCVQSAKVSRDACLGVGKVQFTRVVTFGDSASDVGAYKVGTIAALGGGKYTVNGSEGLTWTERLASMVNAPAECAAQTGLLPNISGITGAAVQNFYDCFNYAQGSSRVNSSGAGIAGVALQQMFGEQNIGVMAVSLREQIENHLTKVGGRFNRLDLVIVAGGGGNDGIMQLIALGRAAAGGVAAVVTGRVAGWPQSTLDVVELGGTAAVDAARAASVAVMAQYGSDLAGYIRMLVVGNGARHVLVRNLANPNLSPFGRSFDAATQAWRATMHQSYNAALRAGLSDSSGTLPRGIIIFDEYTRSEAIAADPAKDGYSNITSPSCGPNLFGGNAILCNASNLVPGDTSRYAYSDSTHPSPYAHVKAAEHAMSLMVAAGWR
jgi:outer membrane lipase/esterase